ncbi:MAG: ASKHA domain-containing protein, partial [Candidatus Omnitrophota bacterium]|nr:ASKHA domain-containing protein [Candidatus Omnitrophota bacterium]
MEKFKVRFVPDNKTVEVPEDTTILSAALSCGLYINSACGGEGVCGRCKVILKKGKVIAPPEGALTPQEKSRQMYLACLTTVHSDIEVEVLLESRLDFENLSPQELELRLKGLYAKSEEIEPAMALPGTEEKFSHSPLTQKLYLRLSPPNLKDRISDLERLYREIQRHPGITIIHTGLANIKQLGELLRDSDWKVTVTLGRKDDICEVINIEPGDTAKRNFGLSFDIGTTTITGQLIDLNSRRILGTRATYNKQATFGSDVITRIIFSQEEKGLEKLHNTLTDTVNQISRQLIEEHKINLNDVTCIFCTGNTTMIHLLLGVDPKYIRREPYVPTANFLPTIRAAEAGININPHGLLQCVPGVASYVGGDTTAGLLSSGIYRNKELGILIDIGTNGEIVLGNEEFLIAAAASAGPAFEGSGLTCGMRSSRGAIQKVRINPKNLDLSYETIGGAKPRGICGSG